ncbi:MAG: PorV/PorQ family protein, partial [Caldithrix sp.]|nr:PorV/PorQ family protein [Caldithrix sp.]
MKIKWIVIGIISLSISLIAQDEFSKVATGTAQFLKIGAGARGTALGDAYTAVTNDVSGMYWNPAGIQKIDRLAVGVSRTELFADITYDYVGAAYPINSNNTIGVSMLMLNSGEIERTTIAEPQGTGETFNTFHSALGITVARRLTQRFDLGVTIKYISEELYREKASTLAFDIGSQFDTGIYGMRIGMILANFGGKMKFDGPDLNRDYSNDETGVEYDAGSRLKTEEWPIPLLFRLGVTTDLIGKDSEIIKDDVNRLTIMLEGNDPVDHLLHYNMGAEYAWKEVIALRAGYKINYDE